MSIRLKVAFIVFVMGIGCLFFGDVRATEKNVANKSVVRKNAAKPVADKSAPVNTNKQKVAKIDRQAVAQKNTAKPVAGKSAPVNTNKQKVAKIDRQAVAQKNTAKPVAGKSAPVNTKKQKVAKIDRPIPSKPLGIPGKLAVQSGATLVVEQQSGDILFQKNANQVMPIASITKLMTAMVVLDSSPVMEAPITITNEDVDYLRGSRSRLPVGSIISRQTALLLALMSSENRAAHALARHYPGGMRDFLSAMNLKAKELGMRDTCFEDPTGLTSNNVSTATDLAKMVTAAHKYQLIRELTTTAEAKVDVDGQDLAYHNTNPLVRSPSWDVGLSKTGYISEAGKCLVMQARLAEKPVVIILLDSAGALTRVGDANRIKQWMDSTYISSRQTLQTVAMQKSGRNPS